MRVVLTNGESWHGAFIRWYTWSWAAHAGIRLSNGYIIDATPSRGVSHHRTISGSKVKEYDVLGLTPEIEKRVFKFLQDQLGKPYDWSAIGGMAVRRDWHDPNKWFCSELVAAAFEAACYPLLHAEGMDRVTPRDLMMSPYLIAV